jgi:hypothetical protein
LRAVDGQAAAAALATVALTAMMGS